MSLSVCWSNFFLCYLLVHVFVFRDLLHFNLLNFRFSYCSFLTTMRWQTVILVFYVCCAMPVLSRAQSYDNVSRLMTDLLDGYDRRQRPLLNLSTPIYVNISFELLALQVNTSMRRLKGIKRWKWNFVSIL